MISKKFVIYKKPIDVGRPRLGLERKENATIRIEPRYKNLISKKFGSIQKWIDSIISKLETKEKE